MQLSWSVPDEGYVAGRAWERAVLVECPLHPGAGCSVVGHGTYERVSPSGMRVPRFLCETRGGTISLLPSFLASHVTGTLDAIEKAAAVAERALTRAEAVEELRPADAEEAVTLPAALRWLLRRVAWARRAFMTLSTLLPALHGTAPTVAAMRARLGTTSALQTLREMAIEHVQALPAPVGFGPRGRR